MRQAESSPTNSPFRSRFRVGINSEFQTGEVSARFGRRNYGGC